MPSGPRGRLSEPDYGGAAQRPGHVTNPTFDGQDRIVEAHALDRDDLDLYGTHVAVDFVARLRATVRFDSVEALVRQMYIDIGDARRLLTAG